MKTLLPGREMVEARGWTHQVQWIENGKPCVLRFTSVLQADSYANQLIKSGLTPVVINLAEALKLK